MDKCIMEYPTFGVIRMQSMLQDNGLSASYERVRRLMRKARIRPILSTKESNEKKRRQEYLSIFVKWIECHMKKSGLANRYYIYSTSKRFYVHDSNY
ncbi:IS3 family transposase [Halosquirtibacter laminarini]|uniref:IS3 family transposase n=1 Tax=Halosquirtibacter laminarini TaxID=3374600 RepID=A0AC61NNJ7_9BACT|nr:IS3 family transposase [Prolixibacteraceae bacterium]